MQIEMEVRRQRTVLGKATFGEWLIQGRHECYTLEDKVREVPGMPVASWKIYKATAIPSGRFRLELIDSPHFGPGTISLIAVPGFDDVRVHSVATVDDTDGCIGVGDTPDKENGTMSGGIRHHVLENLKYKIKTYIDAGHEVWLTVNNPNTI